MSNYGLVTRNLIIGCFTAVVIMGGMFATISDYNHTERDRSIACTQLGGTYNEDGGCDQP